MANKVSLAFIPLSPLFLLCQCAPYSLHELHLTHSHFGQSQATGQAFMAANNALPVPTTMDAPPKPTSPPSASSDAVSPKDSSPPMVMAYYPDWTVDTFPPEKLYFERIDWIDFAFVWPNKKQELEWGSDGSPKLLARLVRLAHAAGKKVKLSVGGWGGSSYFSSAVANEKSRSSFADNIIALYNEYDLDGIDIDWEYPGQRGIDGNEINRLDSVNLLTFFQLLRQRLPSDAKITAAVQTVPFVDESKQPMKDASAFAEVLDWVLLMNYDIWGASPDPGPNAPLMDACKNSTQPEANALAGFEIWTNAGFPPEKLVLGVPSYGYLSSSMAARLRQRSWRKRQRPSDDWISIFDQDDVQLESEDGPQMQFRDLVKQGALILNETLSGNGRTQRYSPAGGFSRHWDECSATPFLRSAAMKQIVAYDDPESIRIKAEFAKQVGMKGVNMFDIHGDTDDGHLVDAVREGLGLPSV